MLVFFLFFLGGGLNKAGALSVPIDTGLLSFSFSFSLNGFSSISLAVF